MHRNGEFDEARTGPKVVLAVSQEVNLPAEKIAPVTDFQHLARQTGAVVVGNGGKARTTVSKRTLEDRTALDVSQAVSIVRNYPDADVYVSFSERVGLPLGVLLKSHRNRAAHVLIAHRLDTRAKQMLEALTGWKRGVDGIITLCTEQLQAARRFLPGSSEFMRAGSTDEGFYRPVKCVEEDYVLCAGSESRDYETLIAAAARAGLNVRILSSSPWSRKSVAGKDELPATVEFLPRVSYAELRELYWKARLVAVPLHDVSYVAGLNGLLEGFCANKAVVVSASRGILDYARHMENSYVVPVGDVAAMSLALHKVYSDRALRERLVSGARDTVGSYANLDAFTSRLQTEILQAASKDRTS